MECSKDMGWGFLLWDMIRISSSNMLGEGKSFSGVMRMFCSRILQVEFFGVNQKFERAKLYGIKYFGVEYWGHLGSRRQKEIICTHALRTCEKYLLHKIVPH